MHVNPSTIQKHVEHWLTTVVIDLNLCPFAQREYQKNSIRFAVSDANDDEAIIEELALELELLNKHDDIETSLLILPNALSDFLDFNDFLGLADELLIKMKLEGIFQIANFHPDYQFAGTRSDDPENYTNRSPYPILHLLREKSLEKAIELHPNTDNIPDDNIKLMNTLGNKHMASLLSACENIDD